jgi:CheY-specific phosphatase CheX
MSMPAERIVTTADEVDAFIVRATAEVLEKMFFTGIETSGKGGEIETESPVQVELHFSGPLTGTLRMRMGEASARALGSTLTCLEPDEFSRERCIQAAGELANMICGCLLSHLEPDANLALTPPEETLDEAALPGSIRRWFRLPEGALAIEFALDPWPCDSLA